MHEGGAGLGAGRINGVFFQQFETLPQPLPELREGTTLSFYPVCYQDIPSGLFIRKSYTEEQSKGS